MKNLNTILIACFFLIIMPGYGQDIIQKLDNTVINCKVIEINETNVVYKLWENQLGPNRSLSRSSIIKIIYENGQVEFFNERESKIVQENTLVVQEPAKVISTVTPKPVQSTKESEKDELSYAPYRFIVGFNSLGYVSTGLDAEIPVIPSILNLGLGYWGHTFSSFSDYTYYSFRTYTSVYAPINKLIGNESTVNKGFFPFFQPGVDIVLQFPEQGGTSFTAGFIWRVGVDYKFTEGFGISYSYSTGNLNNIGILWNW
jgi:hypothetical protein